MATHKHTGSIFSPHEEDHVKVGGLFSLMRATDTDDDDN